MTIFDFLTMLGSLSLFLFGMSVMGTALEKRAGGSLKAILAKLTSGRFSGLLTGLAVTAVIQSSSATTVMVVGFVNSGIMRLSQAAGVIVGKRLGSGDEDAAYAAGRRLLVYGAAGAALLSVLVVLLSGVYVEIYQVEDGVKRLTRQILTAYALVAPCKVLNMILGGGILRSGGRTAYVMAIDLVGTWGFGVPAGLVTAFVFALPVPYVYFALSLEECLRFGISLAVFHRRRWMRRLSAHAD